MELRYERLEKLRHLCESQHLLLQEEARSVALALFDGSDLIVHLGLDQPAVAEATWYQDSEHPYVKAVLHILDQLASWPVVAQLEFMVSPGHDSMVNLQGKLDRQVFRLPPAGTTAEDTVSPPALSDRLQTQRVYVFSRHPND